MIAAGGTRTQHLSVIQFGYVLARLPDIRHGRARTVLPVRRPWHIKERTFGVTATD